MTFEEWDKRYDCQRNDALYGVMRGQRRTAWDAAQKAIRKKWFNRGVIYAVARLIEMHNEGNLALEIIRESGVDVMDGDKYDLTFIKHVADKAMWAKWNRNNSR